MKDKTFRDSITALEHAMQFEKRIKEDPFYFSGIVKCFEVCVEYAWKYLKQKVIEEGLEAVSPKDAIKLAGQVGLIDNVEKWLDFIDDRNLSVHNYLGISNAEYLKTMKEFLVEVKKL